MYVGLRYSDYGDVWMMISVLCCVNWVCTAMNREAGGAVEEGTSQGGFEEEKNCEEEKCFLGKDGNQGRL